jgi:hypothetical protein
MKGNMRGITGCMSSWKGLDCVLTERKWGHGRLLRVLHNLIEQPHLLDN